MSVKTNVDDPEIIDHIHGRLSEPEERLLGTLMEFIQANPSWVGHLDNMIAFNETKGLMISPRLLTPCVAWLQEMGRITGEQAQAIRELPRCRIEDL